MNWMFENRFSDLDIHELDILIEEIIEFKKQLEEEE